MNLKNKLMTLKAELRDAEQHTINALNHIRDIQQDLKKLQKLEKKLKKES